MTVRQAKVTEIQIFVDDFNRYPNVETVILEPLNCTAAEYMDWLEAVDLTRDDLGTGCDSSPAAMVYVDETSPHKVGDIVSISFEEFISSRIEELAQQAKREIQRMVELTYS
jgi:hypothetical protein